jgi:thiamine kinase-like enzyme
MTSLEKDQSQEFFAESKIKERDKIILAELGLNQSEIDELENPDVNGTTALVNFIDRGDKRMVVKKGINVDSNLNSRREYTFLRLLRMRSGDKIAPDPYYYATGPERDLLVMERMEGEIVNEMTNENISKIARAMAQVHKPEFEKPGIPFRERRKASQYDRLIEQVDFLRNWFDELSHYINDVNIEDKFDLGQLTKAKDTILDRAIDAREAFKNNSFSLIHYDLSPGNILKNNERKILFLDWRQASIGDRAMDVAKFFFKNNLDDRQQKVFLGIYSSEINDDTVRERVDVYSPLLRLSSLLWRLRFLNIDIKEYPKITQGVDVELIRARLNDDYEYLINKMGINNNE